VHGITQSNDFANTIMILKICIHKIT